MELIFSFTAQIKSQEAFLSLSKGFDFLEANNIELAKEYFGQVSTYLEDVCEYIHIEENGVYTEERIINIDMQIGLAVDIYKMSEDISEQSALFYAEYFDDTEGRDVIFSLGGNKRISPSKLFSAFSKVAVDSNLGLVGERIRNRLKQEQNFGYALAVLIHKRGGIDEVLIKLREGADPNYISGGSSLLCRAISNKRQDIALALIEFGANINGAASRESPLSWSVVWGCPKVFDMLLEMGADPDARDSTYGRPLHISAREHRYPYVSKLLNAGAKTDLKDDKLIPLEHLVSEFTNCREKEAKQVSKILDLLLVEMNNRGEMYDVDRLISRIKRNSKRDKMSDSNVQYIIEKSYEIKRKYSAKT